MQIKLTVVKLFFFVLSKTQLHRARQSYSAYNRKILLSIFYNNPEVIEIGYTRLVIIFIARCIFSMLYEVMSGYLRGFGFSLVPAILTTVGVCVLRIIWINTVFPANRTFVTIMTAYPVSLATTALLIFIALIIYRPSKRFANNGKEKA